MILDQQKIQVQGAGTGLFMYRGEIRSQSQNTMMPRGWHDLQTLMLETCPNN